jgi:hypothetical protein
LSGVNLSGAYLTRAELTNVRLNIADLSGAHLEWAALGGACLEWANLSGTYPDKPPWEDRAESPYSPGPTTTAGGSVEMPPSAGKQLLPDRLRATRRGMLRNALPPLCRTFEQPEFQLDARVAAFRHVDGARFLLILARHFPRNHPVTSVQAVLFSLLLMIVVATHPKLTDCWLFLLARAASWRFVPPNKASE